MTWPQMKCIFYYFEDEFSLKLCPAHSSTQCKGKVGCRGLWAGRRKVIQAEQHPQRSEVLHIQVSRASIVQPDLLIPSTKSSCRGGVISHNLTAIACLIVSLKKQLKCQNSFARIVLRTGRYLHK